MKYLDKTPAYNLSVVLHETGLKADLVRAWERRYGLPRPQRTEGGHRLYSRYDIETLKWLKEKRGQGLSIRHAVELWNTRIESGKDPLEEQTTGISLGTKTEEISQISHLTFLRQRWIMACLNFDSAGSEDVLNQAFSTHPVEWVVTEIIEKGLNEIGTGWHHGEYSVQQEHFASALADRRLQTLLSLSPQPTIPKSVLVGCPPGEHHALPLLIIDLFLRRKGYKVINLGTDIPIDQMIATTLSVQPDLIILGAQTLRTAASLMDTYTALQAAGITLAYGGSIFNRVPAIRERIPAQFLGEDLSTAVEKATLLLTAPRLEPFKTVEKNEFPELAKLFQQKRAAIDLFVQERMLTDDVEIENIDRANYFFSNDLYAALKLGDVAHLETDLDWVKLLMMGRNINDAILIKYLSAYRDGVRKHLDESGTPIVQWMESRLAEIVA